MNLNIYRINLSNGETLSFCEIDPEVNPELLKEEVRNNISLILDFCTYVDRTTVEKSKKGDTKPLEKALRMPPIGCLLRINKPICSEIKHCVMAEKDKCTTKYLNKHKRKGLFPECWSLLTGNEVDFESRRVANTIIHQWRDGNYVLIIS